MKREITKKIIGLGLMGAFACMTTQAAVLAAWNVSGVEVDAGTGLDSGMAVSPYTLSAGTVSTGVSGELTLSAGPSILPSEQLNQYGFRKTGVHQTTLAGAIANDDYIQFTITADPQTVLHLESIFIRGQTQNGSGAKDIALLSDVGDGFVDTAVLFSVNNGGADLGVWDDTVSLAFPEFQELTGTTTFRLFAYNTSGSGATFIRELGGNDLIINGTTTAAIPEPSTLGLLGVGAILVTWLRKRRI